MVLVGEFQAKKVYLYMEYVPIPIKIKHCPVQGGKNSIKLGVQSLAGENRIPHVVEQLSPCATTIEA